MVGPATRLTVVTARVLSLPCEPPARRLRTRNWGVPALFEAASALAVDSIPVVELQAPESGTQANLTAIDDAGLARALIDRHPAAPRAVWARFSPMVRRIVRRSLGPEQDVEDVVQDVFASLFAKPSRLREPAAFRAFIVS